MARKLIKTEEITENGLVYIANTYEVGEKVMKEKYPKPSEKPRVSKDPEPTEDEIYKAEVLLMLGEILAKG